MGEGITTGAAGIQGDRKTTFGRHLNLSALLCASDFLTLQEDFIPAYIAKEDRKLFSQVIFIFGGLKSFSICLRMK